ncbi:hypothetical protein Rsub_06576 [Raphidocelis subcapitata]|uniref:Uncharacterized protein n=1 Tax=Raphidocelis subcapitata TaxID=307507 RepID=A0A2V0P6F1_9CHLO|nr:hypothetical protein Rsub_06576 [Raphidocelis subcapitata]|eukprot:GBF93443.1 hypothetical protein Rsub_06576 [Raphidocelis subcapitata]
MAWAGTSGAAPQHQSSGAPPAAATSPSTDSLLSRFGLQAGDQVLGRFFLGDSTNQCRWYKGVLRYNTINDARFEECVYAILYEDGETLFYTVEVMSHQLENGSIRKASYSG